MFSTKLASAVQNAVNTLFQTQTDHTLFKIERTSHDFIGDFTFVVFPLLRISKKNPEETATLIGNQLIQDGIASHIQVIKGFLNITLSRNFLTEIIENEPIIDQFGLSTGEAKSPLYLLEYSSPNTNKPLHLGHIRNNLLGSALAKILKASGKNVMKVNLVNDRGIHICKSMAAFINEFSHETPESTKTKGDHLAGKYYVAFDKTWKKQCSELQNSGLSEKEAAEKAPIMIQARELLKKWENNDTETKAIWKQLNEWVLQGFNQTYQRLGIEFDRTEFESEIFEEGRTIVLKGVEKGTLEQQSDGSIWVDLTADGLDKKLLLRSDSTTVYMTQDIATALRRANEYHPNKMIYVVGNEQEYHFKALKFTLKKLGYEEASTAIEHFSYGMVELPEGKMKSREGTVVDADDLMDAMCQEAEKMAIELGKAKDLDSVQAKQLYETIGLGALKYFILKVDPKKSILFDPKESIDFTGNTGPFIQYTHARIKSLLAKSEDDTITLQITEDGLQEAERNLLLAIYDFPETVQKAASAMSPAMIANYAYELASLFNAFYQKHSVLNEKEEQIRMNRLFLCQATAIVLRNSMSLLGITLPEKM